ncbi:MAG: MbcA/ParS/Xre antitoxin family protein [Gammaproteobacteria bacterium]|nr:MbcA/ParS/Xre antitoxin family protein [Gammaproteobacteria bacterium]
MHKQDNTVEAQKAAPVQGRQVLTKAVINASEFMGLSQVLLARTLGLSEATISRMKSGEYLLKTSSKEWELAALLVRLYRSLDAIVAGDENTLRAWLQNYNKALAEVPVNLISKVTGLTKTLDYVDAYRARV